MVVNIVINRNSFIGIDGNGIVVLDGMYDYYDQMEIWYGHFKYGPRGSIQNYKVNKSKREYFDSKKHFDDKYLRELLSQEKCLTINKIIYFNQSK